MSAMTVHNTTSPEHTAGVPKGIAVVKETVARLVIDYYWAFVLVSFPFFGFDYHLRHVYSYSASFYQYWIPGPITLSYYPLYLVLGGLIKSLLQKKVPATLARLRDTGSLEEKTLLEIIKDFERRLSHPLSTILGIVLGLVILWYYRFFWEDFKKMNLDYIQFGYIVSSTVVMIIDVLLAYAGGGVIWKAGVTMWEFSQLGRRGKLKIRPVHPDGCAGLAPIGRLFFSLSFVLVVVGLFCGGWLLYGSRHPGFDKNFDDFAPWFIAGLIAVLVLSFGVFILPLLSLHRLMKKEAAHQETRVLALAKRIAELEESLLPSGSAPNYEEFEARRAQIESWRSTYVRQQKIPTWPVDFETLGKFLSAQIALWIGIPLSLVEHWEKVKPFWETIKSLGPSG